MSGKKEYNWDDIHKPPILEKHSEVKHQVISEYIQQYIKVLTANPTIPKLTLHLIDGFSGGGRYKSRETGNLVYGSPILMYQAVQKAQKYINQHERTKKKLSVDAEYYFIEKKKHVFDILKYSLEEVGINTEKEPINLINDSFINVLGNVISKVRASGRGDQRAIFLLDQYGYSNVPISLLKLLFNGTSVNTEAILTFSTDTIINYLSDRDEYKKGLQKTGLAELFTSDFIHEMKELKIYESKKSRALIEQSLYEFIWKESGARFFTPFFIKSKSSKRSYWLVHLSNHPKARDEMVKIHWSFKNNFAHYGGAGLKMLFGFDPDLEKFENQMDLEFIFDDDASARTKDALEEDITDYFIAEPTRISDIILDTCNGSPATVEQYLDAIFFHIAHKNIQVFNSKTGKPRNTRKSLKVTDFMQLHTNFSLF